MMQYVILAEPLSGVLVMALDALWEEVKPFVLRLLGQDQGIQNTGV